ncbi:MAG: hypothetical protein OK438_07765 [Thaumarchaeota archaeon]|nr:hypothetical protein [Nitrososphaerota archaeon]
MTKEILLGTTTVGKGGMTKVPEEVMGVLSLELKQGERSKLLWTPT